MLDPRPSPSPCPCPLSVGILAIQGDFAAHANAVTSAGHWPRLVRASDDFEELDALVIPGGESTAMLHGINRDGLEQPLRGFLNSGRPVLGTCAGAILLATDVVNPRQDSLAAIDIGIERNAYGTQVDSFDAVAETNDRASPFARMRCILIRAPRIFRTGPVVTVHAHIDGVPVLVNQGAIWAATFHPELTDDSRVLEAVLASGRR